MTDTQRIYDEMWQKSLPRFQTGDYEVDAQIQSDGDTRTGFTVLCRISGEVGGNIERFLQRLRLIEPDQYFYPPTDLHLTVLSVISCYQGFELSDVEPNAYIQVVKQSLENIKPFKIEFRGITASPSCVLVQGFPVDTQLELLRENLRNEFKATSLQTSIDSRYTIATAHTTAARFQVPVTNSAKFLETLSEYRDYTFGTIEIDSVELVFNDWYQRAGATKKLLHYSL